MIYRCHKCGCEGSEDNWVGGFDVNKMTCERCRYGRSNSVMLTSKDLVIDTSGSMESIECENLVRNAVTDIKKIQILEPNVSSGVSCIRGATSKKPIYCMFQPSSGDFFVPTVQDLTNTQLKDILDHRVHMARTNLVYNATHSFEWVDEKNNRLLTYDVYAYVSKFIPAKTYGPPEDCYPAEGGELEDFYVVLTDAELCDNKGNTVKTMKELTWRQVMDLELAFEAEIEKGTSIHEHLQEKLFESAADSLEDYRED